MNPAMGRRLGGIGKKSSRSRRRRRRKRRRRRSRRRRETPKKRAAMRGAVRPAGGREAVRAAGEAVGKAAIIAA